MAEKPMMNIDEARRLAIRHVNNWRGGPNVDAWTEEFAEMDAGTAGAVFVRLRRELDSPPSIARFWRDYRALDTPANQPVPGPVCARCDGTAWVETALDARTVEPCVCRNGTPVPPGPRDVPVTFGDYYGRLLVRLDAGDPSAKLELAGWERLHGGAVLGADTDETDAPGLTDEELFAP